MYLNFSLAVEQHPGPAVIGPLGKLLNLRKGEWMQKESGCDSVVANQVDS